MFGLWLALGRGVHVAQLQFFLALLGDEELGIDDLNSNSLFDFLHLYNEDRDNDNSDDTVDDSPYANIDLKCDYFTEDEFIEQFGSNTGLSYLSLNIQSLAAKFDDFCEFIQEFSNKNFYFDIIPLQEVWKIHDPDVFRIDGYQELVFKSRLNIQGGGVGFYIKDGIRFKVLEELSFFEDKVIETLFIEIYNGNEKNIVGSVYRSNGRHNFLTQDGQIDRFLEIMIIISSRLATMGAKASIFGDFNLDILKFQSHVKTNNYINEMFSQGFLQLITKPTRVGQGSATLIDHIWTNTNRYINISGIITSSISDHFPVFYIAGGKKPENKPKIINVRDYSKSNIDRFKNVLSSLSWNDVFNEQNVELSYGNFSDTFYGLFEVHFPVNSIKFNKKFHKIEPWITAGLLASRRNKLVLLRSCIGVQPLIIR